MIWRSSLIAGLVAALPLVIPLQQPGGLAIVNVSIVPMDRERVVAGQTVLVADGRITAVGPASSVKIPGGAQRIDGAGKFLMPGLTDMHAHFSVTGNAAQDEAENERLAVAYLAHGITT